MKKIFILLLVLAGGLSVSAQKNVTLTIKHLMNDSTFAFNKATKNDLGNDLSFDRVQYYISSISIIHDGGTVTPVTGKYIIVDCNGNFSESLGSFNVTSVEGIKFSIGVDAATNHTDPSTQPSGHPLSFQAPSMHWGWSSGYRFVAIEGKGGSSLNNIFQFHGLFDANYFQQTVMAAGVADGNGGVLINLDADYAMALKGVDVRGGGIYHGLNSVDLTVLQNFRDHVFSPGTGIPTSIKKLDLSNQLNVYPIPSNGSFSVDLSGELGKVATQVQVIDILGRMVSQQPVNGSSDIKMNLDAHGMFFLQVLSENEVVAATKLILQ